MSPATPARSSGSQTRGVETAPAPSRPWQIGAWVVTVVVLGGQLVYSLTVGGLDFSVYRAGAATLFGADGYTMDLYDRQLVSIGGDNWLPFTYPPFAAILFAPMALLPLKLGVAIMTIFSVAVAWWFAAIIYDYVNHRGYTIPLQDKLGRTATIALLTVVICLSGPWRRGLGLVQINPLIMLLVLGDLLRPAKRLPRGFFIAIAAGIKLTPLAFGLVLLMRKDIKGLVTMAVTFAGTVLLGFLVLPQQAVTFWTSAVSDPSRVGNINYPDNISVQGWLMHLTLLGKHAEMPNAVLSGLHYVLILALLVGVAAAIPALEKRGMRMSVIALTAFLMLQMSPISWSHHNTWLPLIVTALAIDAAPWLFSRRGALRTVTRVLFWVSVIGLYVSPLWIAVALYGSTERLDDVPRISLIVSALPITAMFALVMIWIVQAWRHRADPLPAHPA